jgi:hypothetical protein
MADRQLHQLTGRVPALGDVIGTQDALGVAEQGKTSLQQLKDLLFAGMGISPAKRFVIRFSYTTVFSNQAIMESDYAGLLINTTTRPANDVIAINLNQNVFVDATKCNFQLNTNGTLFVRPIIVSSNQVNLSMSRHDGTPPPAALVETFNNYFITVLIYP